MIGESTTVDAYKIDGHCNTTTLTYLYLLFYIQIFKKFPKGVPCVSENCTSLNNIINWHN